MERACTRGGLSFAALYLAVISGGPTRGSAVRASYRRRALAAVTSPLRRALVTALSSSYTSGHDGHGIAQASVVRPLHLLRRRRAYHLCRVSATLALPRCMQALKSAPRALHTFREAPDTRGPMRPPHPPLVTSDVTPPHTLTFHSPLSDSQGIHRGRASPGRRVERVHAAEASRSSWPHRWPLSSHLSSPHPAFPLVFSYIFVKGTNLGRQIVELRQDPCGGVPTCRYAPAHLLRTDHAERQPLAQPFGALTNAPPWSSS
jgi:hypothetical protein